MRAGFSWARGVQTTMDRLAILSSKKCLRSGPPYDGFHLAPDVARIIVNARDLDFHECNLPGVASRARHTSRRVKARRARRALVNLVQDGGVVLGGCDAVGHLLLLVRDACDLAPPLHRLALV